MSTDLETNSNERQKNAFLVAQIFYIFSQELRDEHAEYDKLYFTVSEVQCFIFKPLACEKTLLVYKTRLLLQDSVWVIIVNFIHDKCEL